MNFTIKPVSAKHHHGHRPLFPSSNHHRPFFSRPISSLSFRSPPPPAHIVTTVKASSSSSPSSSFPSPNPSENKAPNPHLFSETRSTPSLPVSFLKTSLIAAAAAAALFISRLYFFSVKPVIASPSPTTVETTTDDTIPEEERERSLEEQLLTNPNDVDVLRNLMEIRIKNRKIPEAIAIVEKLIELEPNEVEWPLMKSHLHVYNGEIEFAKSGFEKILSKDPLRVEAYHGLVMAASQDDATEDLKGIEKRIVESIKLCKKDNNQNDLRDFKLLLAQIHVIDSKYDDALRVYQELVEEEPKDFRPYLCQGIIYTLLRKKDKADKSFENYRRLVPKGHPYARYFEDNMIATKVFAQNVENERAGSKK